MVPRLRPVLVCVWSVCVVASAQAQVDISAALKQLPRVRSVTTMPNGKTIDVAFEQPVDHANPGGPKFQQHLYLSHTGFDQPCLLDTEGYEVVGARGGELQRILGTPNLITVEHRYFGKSVPNPVVWKQLTIKNAADDMHDIVSSLKTLYKGKWVSTGVSKGGQTSLYFKCFYPNDVDATVAYVAPINVAQEDPRIYQYFDNAGDAETRRKILDLQIAFLKREDEILPYLKVDPKDYSMGVAKAYEYGVLEFPFAMWQYGTKPEGLPSPSDAPGALAEAYRKVNAMYYYSDRGIAQFEAFIYQAFTEIGYYNYDTSALKPYMKSNPNPTNLDLAPKGTKDSIVYNPATLAFVYHTLQYESKNVILVYGETDPWSATALPLIGRTNAVKIVVKGAWHNASISLASKEQKETVVGALELWLGIPLKRP